MTTKKIFLQKLRLLASASAIGFVCILLSTSEAEARINSIYAKDVSTNEFRAITIESWDRDYSGGGYGWRIQTDKDSKKKNRAKGDYKVLDSNFQSERESKLVPGYPLALRSSYGIENLRVFAVRFGFTFPGYNEVDLAPPEVDQYTHERPRYYLQESALSGNVLPKRSCYNDNRLSFEYESNRPVSVECVNGVNVPGIVKEFSVWIMGRGNDYELEAWVEDWKGEVHILKFGSINFIGWRPLNAKVPSRIPQSIDSYPQLQTLIVRKLKLRSRRKTPLGMVYLFLDEFRALSKVTQLSFDGAQLDFDRIDCERKNQLFRLLRDNSQVPEQWPKLVDCNLAPGPAAPLPP